ncbi:MAG: hypothetical protein HC837_07070 [Chloroflexaceae bacterium]|nr:hypothetical protein [Chloroflexaceae bacterium]
MRWDQQDGTEKPENNHLAMKLGIGSGLVLVLGVGARALWPVSTAGLEIPPRPTTTYAEALARFAQLQAQDDATINPLCCSQLLSHGDTTEHVVVLIHGMTNCPHQYRDLAPFLFEQGYNVLLPRMPHNGRTDQT